MSETKKRGTRQKSESEVREFIMWWIMEYGDQPAVLKSSPLLLKSSPLLDAERDRCCGAIEWKESRIDYFCDLYAGDVCIVRYIRGENLYRLTPEALELLNG